MPVQAMNHFTVLSDDLARTTAFYERFLGLRVGWRPPFAFPGAWLYAGDQAVLHVVAGRSLPPERAGVLDHMAFTGTGLAATAAQLTAEGIPCTGTDRVSAANRVIRQVCDDDVVCTAANHRVGALTRADVLNTNQRVSA